MTSYEPPQAREEPDVFEDLYIIEHALAQLKESYRQVIVLRHIDNFSVQETSKILGWSESKVTTLDQRAMSKLRELFGASGKEVEIRNEVRTQHS